MHIVEAAGAAESVQALVRIDVRPKVHFDICSLPGFVNIPLKSMQEAESPAALVQLMAHAAETDSKVVVLCRRGNDSQKAVHLLKNMMAQQTKHEDGVTSADVVDVKGGLLAWGRLHPDFPIY